jgi:hypothetical protein
MPMSEALASTLLPKRSDHEALASSLLPSAAIPVVHDQTLAAIGTNAIRFVRGLPSHSHCRGPLIDTLTRGVESKAAAVAFGVSPSTVAHSHEPTAGSEWQQQRYATGSTRRRLPAAEHDAIAAWICTECPTHSGSPSSRLSQYGSNHSLYLRYTAATEQIVMQAARAAGLDPGTHTDWAEYAARANADTVHLLNVRHALRNMAVRREREAVLMGLHKRLGHSSSVRGLAGNAPLLTGVFAFAGALLPIAPRSESAFERIRSAMPIRHMPDPMPQYDCRACYAAQHANTDDERNAGAAHAELVRVQRAAMRRAIRTTVDDVGAAVILQDFTSIDLQSNVAAPPSERARAILRALIVVIIHGERFHYVVFLCTADAAVSADFFFIRAAWLHLLAWRDGPLTAYHRLQIWSDGSAGQFKNRYALTFYAGLHAGGRHVTVDFSAPHHGHSSADAAAGRIKE